MKILFILTLLPFIAGAADFSMKADVSTGLVRVTGVEDLGDWAYQFRVYAGTDPGLPQMSGTYSWQDGTVTFTPRYPLVEGVQYKAVFCAVCDTSSILLFELPPPAASPSAHVESMYPSTDTLPANQLKLYLEFSEPMARGGIWSHIHLIRDDGKAVELPFLELGQELWSPDQQRLTVLFDPGRIKRGVAPQTEMGEALEPGRAYTFVIDREMSDAHGQTMTASFRRQFLVEAPVRDGIDPKKWKIIHPNVGSMIPLMIEFDRPLDWALLQDSFQIKGPTGEILSGTPAIDRDETRWRFNPSQTWKPGHYELIIDMALEDLAGNHIGRPFDVDLSARAAERITQDTTTLGFDIK